MPRSPATTATFSQAGTYVLRLTASDSLLSTSDDVTITVNPAPPVNQPPVVNAGDDQTITLPAGATLAASSTTTACRRQRPDDHVEPGQRAGHGRVRQCGVTGNDRRSRKPAATCCG